MKIRATRAYKVASPFNLFNISKEIECDVIPMQGMMFTDSGIVDDEGTITGVEILHVVISPEENMYYVELKQDEKHFDKATLEKKFRSMEADGWEYIKELF